jgi:hypothetical protein
MLIQVLRFMANLSLARLVSILLGVADSSLATTADVVPAL